MKALFKSLFAASKKPSPTTPRKLSPEQGNGNGNENGNDNDNDNDNLLAQANAAVRNDNFSLAAALFKQLAEAGDSQADAYVSYGYALLGLEQFAEAKSTLLKAIALNTNNADAHYMLGSACNALGDIVGAEKAWLDSHAISPDIESLYCDLCLLLFRQGKLAQAKTLIQTGIRHYPNNPNMYFYLGNLYSESADYAAAVNAYQQSRQLNPTAPYMLSSYGSALRQTGNLALSAELTQQAIALVPNDPAIFSNYLMGLQYSGTISKQDKVDAHTAFADRFEKPLQSCWGNYSNSLTVNRKLRIGYVSGDFRNHSLIFFIAPILANHDKSKFVVHCYHAYPSRDADTQRIETLADMFVDCHAMTDDELAARVRRDQIDILIDLSGHTGYNRLLVFARKPAPIQMTWLGYQATTGLSAVDYRITEESLDPTGTTEAFHSEKLLRLPSSGAFSPVSNSPDVSELPAFKGEHFTFACLNNPSKISNEALSLWAQILVKAPHSQLLIGNATPALADRLTAVFAQHGIAKDRLLFHAKVSLHDYLQLHQRIDMALDTFPYNGGTTTFHSLWMGVPIIALQGELAISRVGTSIMSGLGLSQFCAASNEQYVERAVHFSNHLQELSVVRSALRPQLAALLGTLTTVITSALEKAFENCWHSYCAASQKTEPVSLNDTQR